MSEMNQSEPFDEVDVESLLSPLRQIEPLPAARAEFRAAVAAELERGTVHRHSPWWRRTIAVPVPVALTAVLLVVVSMALTLLAQRRVGPSGQLPQATSPAPAESVAPNTIAAKGSPFESPEIEYYSSETYLCGIGRISSVSGYSIREEAHAP